MIPKNRLVKLWNRTLISFSLVQAIGVFVLATILIYGDKESRVDVRLVIITYMIFILFSVVLLWTMRSIKIFIERNYGGPPDEIG